MSDMTSHCDQKNFSIDILPLASHNKLTGTILNKSENEVIVTSGRKSDRTLFTKR